MRHHQKFSPEHFSDPKVIALQTTLRDRDPFCSGICVIPDHHRLLHYTHDDLSRRIDFSSPGTADLEALYRACKPAEFGRNGENILDDTYRKAGKMDLTSFSTLFDPRDLGIHEQVSKALLTDAYVELYKLNVYGKGDFFKAHKDTPQGEDMFGSLVVVFPTTHEGGQFVLREEEKEWTLDFTDKFASATEPSVCFVAFYGDIEHEVLPVTSGYRVTLTYNLYYAPVHPSTSSILSPFHSKLKQALADIVNEKSTLPNGGYLGFGLVHEYPHTRRNLLEPLLDQLKGSDRALADVCDELGLCYSFRLFYRGVADQRINLITTEELEVNDPQWMYEVSSGQHLAASLGKLTIEKVEGVILVGGQYPFEPKLLENSADHWYGSWLKPFYRTPITEVLEITPMKSSVEIKATFMTYGNEAELDYFYGTACMLIAVDPAESRDVIEM